MAHTSTLDSYHVRTRVARRYGKCSKTIKRWYMMNRFPRPDLTIGPYEYWHDRTLNEFDRQRAPTGYAKPPATQPTV